MQKEESNIYKVLREDLGKGEVESYISEVSPLINEASMARKRLQLWAMAKPYNPGKINLPGSAWLKPEPKGVALIISPWNYPIQLSLAPLIASISAGNTSFLKPSELAPKTANFLAENLPNYLDPTTLQIALGNKDVASSLLDLPFNHIFFTGSTSVGKIVMEKAAKNLADVTLELGGKSPTIVLKDADLRTSANRIIWGKTFNSGQTCIAPDYVLVEKAASEKLIDELINAMNRQQSTDPTVNSTRIISESHFLRLKNLIETSNGKLVTGGSYKPEINWIEPTIILNPQTTSPIMQEEIFGPILPIIEIDSLDSAIEFVNSRPKPLALYAFSTNSKSITRIINKTSSGGVCINHVMTHFGAPNLPFGGVNESGLGSYHGRRGFEELSHFKPIVKRPFSMDPSFAYPPYNDSKFKIIKKLL